MIQIKKIPLKDTKKLQSIDEVFAKVHSNTGLDLYRVKLDYLEILDRLTKKRLSDEAFFIRGAYDKRKLVGFIRASIEKRSPIYVIEKIGFIHCIMVKPDYLRKGIAKQLLKEAEKWFLENNVDKCEIDVVLKNLTAIEASKKLGFKTYQNRMVKQVN